MNDTSIERLQADHDRNATGCASPVEVHEDFAACTNVECGWHDLVSEPRPCRFCGSPTDASRVCDDCTRKRVKLLGPLTKQRKKTKRMTSRTVPDAARVLRERYGDRAQQIASDRADDAQTLFTATFYEQVQAELRK